MAKFKKGEMANPGVRNLPFSRDLIEVRKLTRREFQIAANKYLFMNSREIKSLMEGGTVPMLDMMIMSIMWKAVQEGDERRFNFLLDRLIGGTVKRIAVRADEDEEPPIELSLDEKKEMIEVYKRKVLTEVIETDGETISSEDKIIIDDSTTRKT